MSTATVAQPTTKLVDGLEGADIDLMWCSAVLFEESFWYDEDAPWGIYYDELSYELEMTAREAMNVAGFSQERQDAVWETYDAAAFELAEAEDGTFLGLVDECESAYGHLATPPKK
ncbi:hypothetical protein [Pelagibacterium xiamenense]|uniref:hypothetical protein n=1 Tax=Pelagibacterium xiamenense TaxID=2901140 RepID=UPI001E3907CB|nr:hypothetical protein [Pelagibacterium xiamenense]MCD7061081.1 hypothetical protein [Pelagibacterium xiamenense]